MKEAIRKIRFKVNSLFNIRLASDPFISGDTFRKLADVKIDDAKDLSKVNITRNGVIIFCATHVLDVFIEKKLPRLKNKFILITHNSDFKIDQKYLMLLDHELLIHWFAQNNTIIHKKITSIPIGLENRFYHNHGILSKYKNCKRTQKTHNIKILCSFSLHTNPSERKKALTILTSLSFVDLAYVKSDFYFDLLSSYAFIASPQGNGIDCHRTWEAIYFGVIPIVQGKEFYSKFPEFPGLVLNQWEDLLSYNETSIFDAYKVCLDKLHNSDFIWMSYWEKLINLARDRSENLE